MIRLVARYDDEHGVLDVADLDDARARPGASAPRFACGPAGLLDALEAHHDERGLPLLTEQFRVATVVGRRGRHRHASPTTGTTVEADGATPILDAAEDGRRADAVRLPDGHLLRLRAAAARGRRPRPAHRRASPPPRPGDGVRRSRPASPPPPAPATSTTDPPSTATDHPTRRRSP